jgi:hypothetical protein
LPSSCRSKSIRHRKALPLDLAHLPVLIVTKDAEFVGDLIEPLEAWRSDPRWIGAGDAALAYLETFDTGGVARC